MIPQTRDETDWKRKNAIRDKAYQVPCNMDENNSRRPFDLWIENIMKIDTFNMKESNVKCELYKYKVGSLI